MAIFILLAVLMQDHREVDACRFLSDDLGAVHVINNHPAWKADGVVWLPQSSTFLAVYLPKSSRPQTITVIRGDCQCVQRSYWDSAYRRGADWVDIPVPKDTFNTIVTIYVHPSGDPAGYDLRYPLVAGKRLSELPHINYPQLFRRRRPS